MTLTEAKTKYPHCAVTVHWSKDNDADWHDAGEAVEREPDAWQCWQSEVKARTIHNGEIIHASAYLGGTWERFGDDPLKSNPEISGYLPQMVDEAIELLKEQIAKLPK